MSHQLEGGKWMIFFQMQSPQRNPCPLPRIVNSHGKVRIFFVNFRFDKPKVTPPSPQPKLLMVNLEGYPPSRSTGAKGTLEMGVCPFPPLFSQ